MVKEKMDGDWSLPGGWGDIDLTPSEVTIKETKAESGFDVKAIKLISVFDKKCPPHPPSLYHAYKMFIQCEIIGGRAEEGKLTLLRSLQKMNCPLYQWLEIQSHN